VHFTHSSGQQHLRDKPGDGRNWHYGLPAPPTPVSVTHFSATPWCLPILANKNSPSTVAASNALLHDYREEPTPITQGRRRHPKVGPNRFSAVPRPARPPSKQTTRLVRTGNPRTNCESAAWARIWFYDSAARKNGRHDQTSSDPQHGPSGQGGAVRPVRPIVGDYIPKATPARPTRSLNVHIQTIHTVAKVGTFVLFVPPVEGSAGTARPRCL